jgi:bacterioferritin
MLNVDEDIDSVLELFELKVYDIKKDIYSNLGEWELVLDHIDDERISKISSNPKGHGDLLLKELLWIRKCEEKHAKNV